MEFSPDKAKEIILKYSLKANAMQVWKNRGKIPDQYADANYTPRSDLTDHDRKELGRLIRVLKNEKIYALVIARQEAIPYSRIRDAMRLQSDKRYVPMRPENILQLKKNVQELRISVKKVVESLQNKERFGDKARVDVTKLLSDARLNEMGILCAGVVYNRHMGRRSLKSTIFEDWEVSEIRDKLSVFLLESAF